MISLRKFIESDIAEIDPRISDLKANPDKLEYFHAAISGYTYTFTIDNRPVAIVSCNVLWDGCGQVWCLISNEVRGHGYILTRYCIALLESVAEMANIRRMHSIIHSKIPENIRWAEIIGFEHEFTMYKAAPDGSDILGYVYWPKGEEYGQRSGKTKSRLQGHVEELLRMAA